MIESLELVDSSRPYESRWRALLRVLMVYNRRYSGEEMVRVIIAGWDPYKTFTFPTRHLPPEIRGNIREISHLVAEVNLAADYARQLKPTKFEIAPLPVSEDDLE